MPSLITKQNKNHSIRNYKTYSYYFYKAQYDLRLDPPKILREQTTVTGNTWNWPFFISLSNPTWRPRSQIKIKTIEHATACGAFIISYSSNISHVRTYVKRKKQSINGKKIHKDTY